MDLVTLAMMFVVLFAALFRRNHRPQTHVYLEQGGELMHAEPDLEKPHAKFYRNDVMILLLVLVIILLATRPV